MNLDSIRGEFSRIKTKTILEKVGFDLEDFKKKDTYDFPLEAKYKINAYRKRLNHLKKFPNYIGFLYNINLKRRVVPIPYVKASIVLYLLEEEFSITEIADILDYRDHTTVIHYRDNYKDCPNRLFKIIKEDVYKLLSEFEAEEGGTNAITN